MCEFNEMYIYTHLAEAYLNKLVRLFNETLTNFAALSSILLSGGGGGDWEALSLG